jgi:hypothetical protein
MEMRLMHVVVADALGILDDWYRQYKVACMCPCTGPHCLGILEPQMLKHITKNYNVILLWPCKIPNIANIDDIVFLPQAEHLNIWLEYFDATPRRAGGYAAKQVGVCSQAWPDIEDGRGT